MSEDKSEGGYTRFPHFLLEKLAEFPLSSAEYKILLTIARQTIGYHKASAPISISYLSSKCRINTVWVSKTVNRLIERCVIIEMKKPGFAKKREVCINKRTDEWISEKKTVVQKDNNTVVQKDNKTVVQKDNHIKDNYKDNFKDRGSLPTLELITDYCIKENLSTDLGKKFFEHYQESGWLTNKGSDIRGFWQRKLKEWYQNEKTDRSENKKSFAGYDKSLVYELFTKDD